MNDKRRIYAICAIALILALVVLWVRGIKNDLYNAIDVASDNQVSEWKPDLKSTVENPVEQQQVPEVYPDGPDYIHDYKG